MNLYTLLAIGLLATGLSLSSFAKEDDQTETDETSSAASRALEALEDATKAIQQDTESTAAELDKLRKFLDSIDQLEPAIYQIAKQVPPSTRSDLGYIGVTLGASVPQGVEIADVMPGGPAAAAGLEAGDIVTKIDGVSVPDFDDPIGGVAGLISSKGTNHTVRLNIRRGDESFEKAIETVSRLDLWIIERQRSLDRARLGRQQAAESLAKARQNYGGVLGYSLSSHGPHVWSSTINVIEPIEIMEIEADLGHYFDVEFGVLVVDVPDDEDIPIRRGDILLSIDENNVRAASQALKYAQESEGEIEIVVQRKKREKRINIDADKLILRDLGI